MASMAELRAAIEGLFQRTVNPTPGTNFFETRTTRTPGVVMDIPDASGKYIPSVSPRDMVMGSSLEAGLRDQLANLWQQKESGVIQVRPDMPSKILRHEQIHNVWDKGGLNENYQQIAPMLDQGWKNYVSTNPGYALNNPDANINEATAYQLSSNDEPNWLPPEQHLKTKIAKILTEKGKSVQADQIKKLGR